MKSQHITITLASKDCGLSSIKIRVLRSSFVFHPLLPGWRVNIATLKLPRFATGRDILVQLEHAAPGGGWVYDCHEFKFTSDPIEAYAAAHKMLENCLDGDDKPDPLQVLAHNMRDAWKKRAEQGLRFAQRLTIGLMLGFILGEALKWLIS